MKRVPFDATYHAPLSLTTESETEEK